MNLSKLAEDLRSGAITLPEWEASMRDFIRQEYITAMELAKGGREFITQSDWGWMGSELKKQYQFLNNFAKDIAANPEAWMNGRLDARMNLYKESAYSVLENAMRREAERQGFDEERRILGATDKHCPDCLEAAAQGWQSIGTLPAIGDSVCITNCKCEFEYRKSGADEMLFAPAENTDMLFAPGLEA